MVSLKQVQAQPGRLATFAGQTAVAVEEEAGVGLGDGGELGDVFLPGDAEILFP